MGAIYHLVPKNMVGSRLIPMNRMKELMPEAYSKEVSKYRGREKILQRRIPKIECLWNDVLHFSPVSPAVIFGRLRELGFGKFDDIRWFTIPIELISDLPTVVYRAPPKPRPDFGLRDEDVEFLAAETWSEPETVPDETEIFFRQCKKQGHTLFPFQFVPHILVLGEIDVSHLKICRI